MVKVSTVVAFLVLGIAWVLLIVSYSTYWYSSKVGNDDNYVQVLFKADGKKIITKFAGGKSTGSGKYTDYEKDTSFKNRIQILQTSLAFTIIAWVFLCASLFALILSLIGILGKIPLLPTISKILPIGALITCLLSALIFLGYGNASEKDCERVFTVNACNNKFLTSEDDYYLGPYTSWATTVVSAFFILVGTLVSLIGGAF
ncbi:hypothetical protein CYY_002250 [Polysphondylium violaceum]|uniref:Transmembrane protein n=1 Tax=Polysphondylium violaceum TaxID=133409 RepID=A0A8J4Q0H7_9MYCE|nr:hypothetical protein CYY_002250 [Polysphondylium violaceum]